VNVHAHVKSEVCVRNRSVNSVHFRSLGCTVIEMFTADVPWNGLERVTIILRVASGNIPELPEHASESAKTFMSLSLKPDPSKRPWTQSLLFHEFVTGQVFFSCIMNIYLPELLFSLILYATLSCRLSACCLV
jgi:serine/threonine protein kinase